MHPLIHHYQHRIYEIPISVIIGPADYGEIAPADTTEYKRVNPGDNDVYLNGELSYGSPARFGSGNMGLVYYYTYYFNEHGEGFSWDYE